MRVHVLAGILLLSSCSGPPQEPGIAAEPGEARACRGHAMDGCNRAIPGVPAAANGPSVSFRGPSDRHELVSTPERRICCGAPGLWRRPQQEICRGRSFTAWNLRGQCHPHAAGNANDDRSSPIFSRGRFPRFGTDAGKEWTRRSWRRLNRTAGGVGRRRHLLLEGAAMDAGLRDATCRAQADARKLGHPSGHRATQWRPHGGDGSRFGAPATLRSAAGSGSDCQPRTGPRSHRSVVERAS